MSFAKKCLFIAGILMTGTFAWSSQSSANQTAMVGAPASSTAESAIDADTGEASDAGVISPFCPFICNSTAQCNAGCPTEALCVNHHCITL